MSRNINAIHIYADEFDILPQAEQVEQATNFNAKIAAFLVAPSAVGGETSQVERLWIDLATENYCVATTLICRNRKGSAIESFATYNPQAIGVYFFSWTLAGFFSGRMLLKASVAC